MREIETKIIHINIDETRNKLIGAKAKRVKMENQINNLYDFPNQRLLKEKGYARIRIVEDLIQNETRYYMTTKKLISQEKYKVMEENEVIISDGEVGKAIFLSLGLVLKNSIKKSRESYQYKNTLVEIDINDKSFCPFPYLEIETNYEDELKEVVNILGYTLEDTTSKTIYQILKEERTTKGL